MHILVTRPIRDTRRTASKLEALGRQPVCAPIFTIEPTDIPIPDGIFDIVIVTSANGADQLHRLEDWTAKTIYAVAPRTAEAILEHGSATDLRIAQGDAVSLIGLITAEQSVQSSILHITGIDHKAEPDASLRAAGYPVKTWTAYHSQASETLPEVIIAALKNDSIDAVLHYSRRSASVLLDLVAAQDLTSRFLALKHYCLSEDVAIPLRAEGASAVLIASAPSEDALLALL
ncbi:uroporphyrinogen-III synthase [Microvirga sp. W0021]|uniref:Uroporphyrinogen-III synthase n=1 Tax=Hohaiivirga grylli TaxID=3133970 RepID=A0ABV0BFK9_9HYPH